MAMDDDFQTTAMAQGKSNVDSLNAYAASIAPMWLITTVTVVAETAMIFGGIVPFIPQTMMIRRRRSCEGFNTLVCFNLLIANILRILFWCGRPFELPLLASSVLMVGMMLYMMHACVETYQFEGRKPVRMRAAILSEFWLWTDYADYLTFIALFTVFVGALTYMLSKITMYIEILGFCAVFVEAIQGVPQLLRNRALQSTRGMSVTMIAMWLSGDTFKTLYFITRKAPFQFGFCGSLQVCVDCCLIFQVCWYARNHEPVQQKPLKLVP
eukprot:m.7198 g.7198  ORF g.7198 m.7198 type:complete len:269 (-) comp3666_c0_seq1:36-842(-)